MKLTAVALMLFAALAAPAGELQDAAARGNLDRVRALLSAAPASVNQRDRGTTALHEAARAGHLPIVQLLLARGANVNAVDISGATPLRLANGYRRAAVAEFLRQHGALEKIVAPPTPAAVPAPAAPATVPANPVTAPTSRRDVALNRATPTAPSTRRPSAPQPAPAPQIPAPSPAQSTNRTSARDLLPVIYPIHEAARIGDIEQIKFLFKSFPDLVNSTDEKALTPLHVSAANRQFAAASVLVALHADVNARSDSGQTPLHLAVRHGDLAITGLLLTNRANVNARDNFENTPLLTSAQSGPDEGLQAAVLVGERFGKDVQDKKATVARLNEQQLAITQLLLAHGADVNARNRAGSTALLHAARLGNEGVVRAVLAAGANPNVEDSNGRATPLHVAAGRGSLGIVRALLAGRADVNMPDARGETPLCYALREARLEIAALLKAHGGNIGTPPPMNQAERSLVTFYEQTESALQKAGASEKARIILGLTPTRAEIARMFPRHAAAAAKIVEQLIREVKQGFQKPVTDAEAGQAVWRVRPEPPSLLAQDWRDRGWIARDLPLYSVVVDKTGTTSRPGDYCYVNGRWVMLPPLRAIAAQQQAALGK